MAAPDCELDQADQPIVRSTVWRACLGSDGSSRPGGADQANGCSRLRYEVIGSYLGQGCTGVSDNLLLVPYFKLERRYLAVASAGFIGDGGAMQALDAVEAYCAIGYLTDRCSPVDRSAFGVIPSLQICVEVA